MKIWKDKSTDHSDSHLNDDPSFSYRADDRATPIRCSILIVPSQRQQSQPRWLLLLPFPITYWSLLIQVLGQVDLARVGLKVGLCLNVGPQYIPE